MSPKILATHGQIKFKARTFVYSLPVVYVRRGRNANICIDYQEYMICLILTWMYLGGTSTATTETIWEV